jgi:hypothetical protein
MTTAIMLRNVEAITVEIQPEIKAQVAAILADCRSLTTVSDPLDFDAAVTAQREASQLTKSLDSVRKDVTRPLDEMKAKAIELVRQLTDPLASEISRLSTLNAAFEAQRRLKAEEAARKIREEQAAKEREALRIAQAERQRIQEETRAKLATAAAEDRAKLEADAARRQQEADDAARAKMDAAHNAAALASSQAVSAKPSGLTLRVEPAYEITDAKALFAVRPEWFEVKPRDGLIKSSLRQIDPSTTIPGLRHWREEKVSAR